jgi:hypothetical protein
MTRHSELTAIHAPYNWSYDDATEREAATGFVPADVGKLARQLDDNSLWMLTDDDPKTWVQVGGSGGGSGVIVQKVNVQTGAVATGTTLIPIDDTIPQNTEGDQYMSLSITPTSVTNDLYIHITVVISHNVALTWMMTALFQDSVAGALAAMISYADTQFAARVVTFTHKMAAGTTGSQAGTLTFNGVNASRYMGGIMASSITIEEIVP